MPRGCLQLEVDWCAARQQSDVTDLFSHFPVRLTTCRLRQCRVAVFAYWLSYGGGLVSGDHVCGWIRLRPAAMLVIMTQGSTKVSSVSSHYNQPAFSCSMVTKVFGPRHGQSLAATEPPTTLERASFCPRCTSTDAPTLPPGWDISQHIQLHVESGALLCWLPEPVTPYAGAQFQQRIMLHGYGAPGMVWERWASVVFLDWYTSGRQGRGECWQFDRIRTRCSLYLTTRDAATATADNVESDPPDCSRPDEMGDTRETLLFRDAWTMQGGDLAPTGPLSEQHVFGMMFLLGPRVHHVTETLLSREQDRKWNAQPATQSPHAVLYSVAPLTLPAAHTASGEHHPTPSTVGCIIRFGGVNASRIRRYLHELVVRHVEPDSVAATFLRQR